MKKRVLRKRIKKIKKGRKLEKIGFYLVKEINNKRR